MDLTDEVHFQMHQDEEGFVRSDHWSDMVVEEREPSVGEQVSEGRIPHVPLEIQVGNPDPVLYRLLGQFDARHVSPQVP